MKRLVPCFLLALCLPVAAAGHSFRDADHWASVWDDPERDAWQKPLTVLEFLGIERGETVADLGAGTGYFTKLLSIQVGPEGKVYAVDVEQTMLDHLMAREDMTTERVVPVLAKKNDPGLPQGAIDVVMVVNTWHHVGKRTRYLPLLGQSLSPEGRVAIIDYRKGDLPVGPRPNRKLSRNQVIAEFESTGWRFVAESVALPYQYLLVFRPPAGPASSGAVNP